jgi:virulence-associated protein VapD
VTGMMGHNSQISSPGGRMYAIVFDFDTTTLEQTYGSSTWRNAYQDVRKVLEKYGFEWQQGSTYFGKPEVSPVTCVLAVQDISRSFGWFGASLRDIRMLRIEENNDLMPVVELPRN